MSDSQKVLAQNNSYRVAYALLTEIINELQSHNVPRFDVLHELVVKSDTLFEGMSPIEIEESAKYAATASVRILCKFFANEYSLAETLRQILALRNSLEYSWDVFRFDTTESNWYRDSEGRLHVASKMPHRQVASLPEIERHSFLN